jgi:serine/threonine protein phosphatase PrpC
VTDYAADDAGEMAVILEEIARKPDLGMACRALVDKANEGGGGDNITVVLARLIW